KESKASEIVIDEEELSDHKIKDDGCEVDKEEEWVKYEEPIDLVDTNEESIYESLIEKMPICSLNFNFRIEKGNLSNLKIQCMIGRKFIANAYIDLDSPMNVMSLACYNAIRNWGDIDKLGPPYKEEIERIDLDVAFEAGGSRRNSEMDDLTSKEHDLLSTRVILSEDDYKRGCKRESNLESGFYKDIDKLGPSYKEEIERIDLDVSFKASDNANDEGVT
nr:hypothetical protein [Tanacetum cinerariifolium]